MGDVYGGLECGVREDGPGYFLTAVGTKGRITQVGLGHLTWFFFPFPKGLTTIFW
jgi:hypothetical protein